MIIVQTPLRVSFAGGGTDFREFYRKHGGAVVSTAIDKYIHVVIKERFDDLIVLNYSRREIVNSVDQIQHGLIRESLRKTGIQRGIEITTLADIPSEGSGLGSSSSLLVGILHTFYTYQGKLVTAEQLAEEACEIEIDILQNPIGIQDQYIAAYGGLRAFSFEPDGRVTQTEISLSPEARMELSSRIMLFFLNKTRPSSSVLEDVKKNIPNHIDSLIRLRDQALSLRDHLPLSHFDVLGEVMDRGWRDKKSLSSRVSDPEIDALYETAMKAGALGGKVAGAGGGGFLLLYVPPGKRERVREALRNLRQLPIQLEPDGSKVVFNQRRHRWK